MESSSGKNHPVSIGSPLISDSEIDSYILLIPVKTPQKPSKDSSIGKSSKGDPSIRKRKSTQPASPPSTPDDNNHKANSPDAPAGATRFPDNQNNENTRMIPRGYNPASHHHRHPDHENNDPNPTTHGTTSPHPTTLSKKKTPGWFGTDARAWSANGYKTPTKPSPPIWLLDEGGNPMEEEEEEEEEEEGEGEGEGWEL